MDRNYDPVLNPTVDTNLDIGSLTNLIQGLGKTTKPNPFYDDSTLTDSDRWLMKNKPFDVESPQDAANRVGGLASFIDDIRTQKQASLAKQKELEDKDLAMIRAMDEQVGEEPEVARARAEGRQLTPEELNAVSTRAENKNTPKVSNFWKEAIAEPISKTFGW